MNNNNNEDPAKSFRNFLIGLSRPVKQLVVIGVDAVGFAVSAIVAAWLLFTGTELNTDHVTQICLITLVVSLPLAWALGLYRSVVRYMGLDLFIAGAKTAAGSALVGAAFLFFANSAGASLRWAVAFSAIAFIYICSSRYIARVLLIHNQSRGERERVIIYGAGSAGAQLAIGLLGGDQFLPVAMIDDDPTLYNKMVKGLVVHPPSVIESLIRDTNATRVLMAMPSATRRSRRAALERFSEFPVHVQTMPAIADLVSGKARVDDISDVDVADLLGRDAVPPQENLLRRSVTGKAVMVTGAGGSIGSEICRQVLRQKPRTLVLFEISEVALYSIEKEIRKIVESLQSDCEVVALLGSVHNQDRVQEVMQTFAVNTVYHAAAYKHVPVVEQNILEGVTNNIFGTLGTAKAAVEAKVETFVLISTDKAVSPTNIMGATKRFSEMILQAMQDQHSDISFCMVRFGNVLESSGSVVPLFREQIRDGGPVTVTHRDIIRYFMTIPEAAELVIQASAMARGGDVFVLDMGEPVRIQDLAHRMIHLMGLTVRDDNNPDGDVEVRFTGLRPAEKLYEELLIGTDVSGTSHPRILRANEEYIRLEALETLIEELRFATQALDRSEAREILLRAVSGYEPTNGIEDLVSVAGLRTVAKSPPSKVIDITSRRS